MIIIKSERHRLKLSKKDIMKSSVKFIVSTYNIILWVLVISTGKVFNNYVRPLSRILGLNLTWAHNLLVWWV